MTEESCPGDGMRALVNYCTDHHDRLRLGRKAAKRWALSQRWESFALPMNQKIRDRVPFYPGDS
jgi:hypothetical protein